MSKFYLVVESRPKNKSEYDQLGTGFRFDDIRVSLDGKKFILKWDSKKKPRPSFLDDTKTKTYTHEEMLKEINKKNSDWETDGPEKDRRGK